MIYTSERYGYIDCTEEPHKDFEDITYLLRGKYAVDFNTMSSKYSCNRKTVHFDIIFDLVNIFDSISVLPTNVTFYLFGLFLTPQEIVEIYEFSEQ